MACASPSSCGTGVKWQSNAAFKPTREVNADDVVFTFNRMLDKNDRRYKVGGGTYTAFDSFVGPSLKSVSKLSDDSVAFDLKTPSAPLISASSSVRVVLDPVGRICGGDGQGRERPTSSTSTRSAPGRFSWCNIRSDSLIRFRANPDFLGAPGAACRSGRRRSTTWCSSITADPAVRFAKLKTGECQVAALSQSRRPRRDARDAGGDGRGKHHRQPQLPGIPHRQEAVR